MEGHLDTVYKLNQQQLHGAVSPLGSIYGSRNQELEVGVASLAVSLREPPG